MATFKKIRFKIYVLQYSKTLAHEIGHALGMTHDFLERGGKRTGDKLDLNDQNCSNKGGIMDYYTNQAKRVTDVKQWTICSIHDFQEQYERLSIYRKYCLDEPRRTYGKQPELLILFATFMLIMFLLSTMLNFSPPTVLVSSHNSHRYKKNWFSIIPFSKEEWVLLPCNQRTKAPFASC